MKAVFLIRSLDYGGAQRQLVTLVKELHHRGHRVVVAVYYANGPLERELHAAGVPVKVFGKRGRWDLWPFLLDLVRFIRQERPQIVHAYLANDIVALLKPLFPGKVVWGVRGSKDESDRSDWLQRRLAWMMPKLAHLPDLIICNSYAGLNDAAAEGFPRHTMVVIPNGIDTDRFRPDPVARQAERGRLGVGEHERLVGLVGRLDPMKDHPTFLKAVAPLARQRSETRFICVGTGPNEYAQTLRDLATDLGLSGRLTWDGTRDDMPSLYNALDVAVLASSQGEGFSNAVGEAMATGVPCVVTDVGDSASIVGSLGEVVPARDAAALEAAICRVLDKVIAGEVDRSAIRNRIVAEFSVPSLLARTEQTLQALTGQTAPC